MEKEIKTKEEVLRMLKEALHEKLERILLSTGKVGRYHQLLEEEANKLKDLISFLLSLGEEYEVLITEQDICNLAPFWHTWEGAAVACPLSELYKLSTFCCPGERGFIHYSGKFYGKHIVTYNEKAYVYIRLHCLPGEKALLVRRNIEVPRKRIIACMDGSGRLVYTEAPQDGEKFGEKFGEKIGEKIKDFALLTNELEKGGEKE